MAKPYELPGGLAGLLRPTTADRIIGDHRSTQTFIRSEIGAFHMAWLWNHARSVCNQVAALHRKKYGVELTLEELLQLYPGCKRWMEAPDQLFSTYASQEGFAVTRAVSASNGKDKDEKKPDSSVQEKAADAGT